MSSIEVNNSNGGQGSFVFHRSHMEQPSSDLVSTRLAAGW